MQKTLFLTTLLVVSLALGSCSKQDLAEITKQPAQQEEQILVERIEFSTKTLEFKNQEEFSNR